MYINFNIYRKKTNKNSPKNNNISLINNNIHINKVQSHPYFEQYTNIN